MNALEAARQYISRGWRPVPIPFRRKGPILDEWEKLRVEESQLGQYFNGKPSNVGVILGEPSEWLVDVDLDVKQAMSLASRFLPSTLTFGHSSKPQSHYCYVSQGATTAKFSDPRGKQPGEKTASIVELRSTGLQTVFPGSIHEDGEPIEFDFDSEENPTGIDAKELRGRVAQLAAAALLMRCDWSEADALEAVAKRSIDRPHVLPDIVAEKVREWLGIASPRPNVRPIRPTADITERARKYIAKMPSAVSGARGHDATFDVALVLVQGFALSDGESLSILSSDYNARCDPPWSEKELKHKIDSAAKANRVTRGWLLVNDKQGWQEQAQQATASRIVPSEWEKPIQFDEFVLPPFPVRALPDWLREFVEAEAEATQTPVDLGATLALSVCAAALAKKAYAEGSPGWRETLNLYTVCALPPASRKTAVFRDLLAPINEWEAEESDRLQPAIVSYLQRKRILEKQLARAEDHAAKAKSKQDREQAFMEAAELAQELDALPVVRAPRAIADDVTPEKLSNLLMDHGGRIALMSPEGGPFEMMAGRYSDKPNFEVYLKGHAGDEIRVDRKNGTADHIKRPAITIGLAVQPDVLRGLAATPSLRARGLLGRFLYSLPQSNIGGRTARPVAVPEALRRCYAARVKAFCSFEPKRDRAGDIIPVVFTLSPAAQEAFYAFRERLEPDLAEFGRLGWIQDWAGKLAGSVLRIVGILGFNNAFQDPSILMSERSLLDAIEIGDYFTAHALAAFTVMGANEATENAKVVLRCIGRHGWTDFTKRDLYQKLKGDARFAEVEALDRPLGVLAEMNWIRPVLNAESSKAGRPPSPRFEFQLPQFPQSSQYRSDQ